MAVERCRIWWPRQPLHLERGSSSPRLVLFGWLFAGAGSVDVVVSAAVPQDQILRSFATLHALQTIVISLNERMPVSLQECATLAILGDCGLHQPGKLKGDSCSKQEQLPLDTQFVQEEHFNQSRHNVISGLVSNQSQHSSCNHRKWGCDCTVLDGFLDTFRKSAVKEGNWVHFFCKSRKSYESNLNQVPVLHHLYLSGQKVKINHCHVILYDVPKFGRNHFSVGVGAPCELKASFKKPNWINNLQKKPTFPDLEPIVLALNCSNAVRLPFSEECTNTFSRYGTIVQVTWHCRGILLASVSTVLYRMILLFKKCLSYMLQYLMLQKVFRHSWNNIYLRSCQICYWPLVLQDTSVSSIVNVEYAHQAVIRKHALCSNIIVDLLMGLVLGAVLLLNTEPLCAWIVSLVYYMTDVILRSGCVWLMGVPAGFKLNTELAELLGMISLNAVQIYSTLWFVMRGFLRHIIQGIAFSGIIFGLTVPVSFLIDIIQLATLHVTMLHWLMSLIYSRQIQTVASLWRLFRGRKWNPLRQRLDSYDYTVEQHVVGSLLFTPVLLLIPTTSVFYIFFSMLSTTVICMCVMLQIGISVIHSTPYAELILWVTRRQRFPVGLFFLHVASCYEDDLLVDPIRGSNEMEAEHFCCGHLEPLVSELHCNYATLAQVIRPNYEKIFNRTGLSFCKQLASGILRGERVPSTMSLNSPPQPPWVNIGIREYWMRCRSSVLSCAQTC